MRVICAVVFFTPIALFTALAPAHAGFFDRFIERDRQRLATWDFSPTKYVDLLTIEWWDLLAPPGQKESMMARLQAERAETLERRCIVTRMPGAEIPTWDGHTAAFIFHPLIWYFDPDRPCDAYGSNVADVLPPDFSDIKAVLHYLSRPEPEPERTPGNFDKWAALSREDVTDNAVWADLEKSAAWRAYNSALEEFRLGFILAPPGNAAPAWAEQDYPTSWSLDFPSEAEVAFIQNTFAARRRMNADAPHLVFGPWQTRLDCSAYAVGSGCYSGSEDLLYVPQEQALQGPSVAACPRRTLLDFMLEKPNLHELPPPRCGMPGLSG